MITHIHQEKNFFMLQSPLINDLNMFDTLSFSQKMQKAGMTEILANEMAFTLRDMNVGHFNTLLTRQEFKNFEKEICFEIEEIRGEMENLVTKTEFKNFEKEIRFEIENLVTKTEFKNFEKEIRVEFKNEIEKMVTKTEFNTKIKNLELNITIKMGAIMATGIGILTMIIKM